jgi:hypothetical protein
VNRVRDSRISLIAFTGTVGGLLSLLGYNISIAVWVGMIALMGLDAETGVFMLLFLDLSHDECKQQCRLDVGVRDGPRTASGASSTATHDDQDGLGESLAAVKRLLISYRELLHSKLLDGRRGRGKRSFPVAACFRALRSRRVPERSATTDGIVIGRGRPVRGSFSGTRSIAICDA